MMTFLNSLPSLRVHQLSVPFLPSNQLRFLEDLNAFTDVIYVVYPTSFLFFSNSTNEASVMGLHEIARQALTIDSTNDDLGASSPIEQGKTGFSRSRLSLDGSDISSLNPVAMFLLSRSVLSSDHLPLLVMN